VLASDRFWHSSARCLKYQRAQQGLKDMWVNTVIVSIQVCQSLQGGHIKHRAQVNPSDLSSISPVIPSVATEVLAATP
jgi:hypothetical protein